MPFWRKVLASKSCEKVFSVLTPVVFSRLYFTTFPHPPPPPQSLNRLAAEPGNQPRVRTRAKGGPTPSSDDDALYYYFTIDDQLLYLSFFQDWGPLNIAMVYKACILIHELLEVRPSHSEHALSSCHSRARSTIILFASNLRRTKSFPVTDWFFTPQMIHGKRPTQHF